MSEWQPIETAPKDRSVRLSNDGGATSVGVHWDRNGGQFWTDGDDTWTPEETRGWFWAPYQHSKSLL